MTLHEFDIIRQFFELKTIARTDVSIGIGDDAAIVSVPQHHELAITTDTLVAGVHFPISTSAYDIGYKALAVNLSDLAAMGATPAWITLSLTLPDANPSWLKQFSDGFFTLAQQYQLQLIGGDLTHGSLSVTIQAFGFVPKGKALTRSHAKPGDLIYVTNTLGDAGLALQSLENKLTSNIDPTKLNRPEPQILTGEKLLGIAHSAIDISDGLAADLGHILERSAIGASVDVESLPFSAQMKASVSLDKAIQLALTAGDDYELCFTVPENKKIALEQTLTNLSYTCIGKITATRGLDLHYRNGEKYVLETNGYQHF